MMSFQDELRREMERFAAEVPAQAMEVLVGAIRHLVEGGAADHARRSGDRAPDFTLPNLHGQPLRLGDRLRAGPVVLSFYRGGWCPFCNVELVALQFALPEIRSLGAELIAVSPQLPDQSLTHYEKQHLQLEVLSDRGNRVSDEYGLGYTMEPAAREVYERFGLALPEFNGDDSWRLPIPATYVIDRDGTIVWHFVDPDYTKRGDPAEVVVALRALRG